jgi:acyl carrier protein
MAKRTKADVRAFILDRMCQQVGVDEEQVHDRTKMADLCGKDELDLIELVMDIEDEYGIDLGEPEPSTFGGLVRLVEARV